MRDIASRLRGVFKNSMVSVLAASGPLALAGCGDDDLPPGIEGDPGFVPVTCDGNQQSWLVGLNPGVPTEYTELRFLDFQGASRLVETQGTRCGGATNFAACEDAFAALGSGQGFPFNECTDAGCFTAELVATQGDAAVLIASIGDLISFLGPIDTPNEAMLISSTTRVNVSCVRGGAKPAGDGFDVQAFTHQGCDGRTRHIQHVDAAGNLRAVDTVVEKKANPNCAVGRRPFGLIAAAPCASPSALGRYLADAARLEAASIAAFRRLRRELRLHGAPRRLLAASQRAARDEVRHARVVGALARSCGATPAAARIAPLPLRDLEAIAVENATEGCVRETYGALVGQWQARFARQPAVRAAYARIADDELRHAALAWRVAAWADTRLSAKAKTRVRKAREAAVEELLKELAAEPDRELMQLAGVPAAAPAVALAEQLRGSIWS